MVGAAKRLLLFLPLPLSRAIRFRRHAGRWPRLRDPQGINEKINWRILHDHRDVWNWTCDKLESKRRVQALSPGILLPDVLWSGEDVTELAHIALSGRWILKSNSSSQDLLLGTGSPNIAEVVSVVEKWKTDFQWRVNGERAYARARRVAILERWIGESDQPPMDYKVFVFHGAALYVHVHSHRFTGHRASLYTRDWQMVPTRQAHIEPHSEPVARPQHLAELLRRAEEIAAGFDFLRVDLYDTEVGVWFGETTPYSWSGLRPFLPRSYEIEIGNHWNLPDRAGLQRHGHYS